MVASQSRAQPLLRDQVFFAALTEDTGAPVLIADGMGVIEFANPAALTMLGSTNGASVAGKQLAEFLGEDVARDRLGIGVESATTGQPVTVTGMVRGRLLRATFRGLSGTGASARLLITFRLASPPDGQVGMMNGDIKARIEDRGMLAGLTQRELEILRLIGLGLSSADIAKRLERSVKTVEWHRVSLGEKLGVSNRVELARIAIAAGIVSAEHPPIGGRSKTE
jgi:DNA-binding CsgD family transcriptional regulator